MLKYYQSFISEMILYTWSMILFFRMLLLMFSFDLVYRVKVKKWVHPLRKLWHNPRYTYTHTHRGKSIQRFNKEPFSENQFLIRYKNEPSLKIKKWLCGS